MDLKKVEFKIKDAIDAREEGKLEKSRELFEEIISDLKRSLRTNSPQDLKYLYATAVGEYVIQYRLEARRLKEEALRLGKQLLNYDKKHKLDNPLSIRSVTNTLLNLGMYEEAEEYSKQLISLYKDNSGRQGDSKAHLAYIYLRTIRLKKAKVLIEDAIDAIKRNTAKEPYVSIWLPHALMVKSLIFNTEGKTKDALKFAKEALEIAEKDNRVFRIKQAQQLVNYLIRKRD
ncbi:hypothetical protein KAT60_02125 [Candidatus Woesebacteria bacterium]|nr:hypothetical protein [Candidatus Woesebacteria bacterium]